MEMRAVDVLNALNLVVHFKWLIWGAPRGSKGWDSALSLSGTRGLTPGWRTKIPQAAQLGSK